MLLIAIWATKVRILPSPSTRIMKTNRISI